MSHDIPDRKLLLAQERARTEERQRAHLADIDKLDEKFGFSYEDLASIYGAEVLLPENPTSWAVKRWLTFLETLRTTDKSMVTVATTHKQLQSGCYGFGQKERYELVAEIIVITNPQEAAMTVGTTNDPDSFETTTATIQGTGYRLYDINKVISRVPKLSRARETFDDLTEPPITLDGVVLAQGLRFSNGYIDSYDRLRYVATGDSFMELFHPLKKQVDQSQSIGDLFGDYTYSDTFSQTGPMRSLVFADLSRRRKAKELGSAIDQAFYL